MRRVDIEGSFSESVIVEDRYEGYIEEHLGVSNRNLIILIYITEYF